ncbi:MAG: hypothetical protein VX956_12620 [Gemmatimonadota bacterium]|nr:hypothetical protein [Gemmatimonadota bacterium]
MTIEPTSQPFRRASTGIKYPVNFQVGNHDYSCDPELEIGMDDE